MELMHRFWKLIVKSMFLRPFGLLAVVSFTHSFYFLQLLNLIHRNITAPPLINYNQKPNLFGELNAFSVGYKTNVFHIHIRTQTLLRPLHMWKVFKFWISQSIYDLLMHSVSGWYLVKKCVTDFIWKKFAYAASCERLSEVSICTDYNMISS